MLGVVSKLSDERKVEREGEVKYVIKSCVKLSDMVQGVWHVWAAKADRRVRCIGCKMR